MYDKQDVKVKIYVFFFRVSENERENKHSEHLSNV